MLERKYFHTRTRILKNQTMVWGYLVTWSALRSAIWLLGLLSGAVFRELFHALLVAVHSAV